MDDFLMIRFALDNVRPRSLGEGARAAFDRVLNGEAMSDGDSRDGRSYARLRANRAGRIHGITTGIRATSQRAAELQLASDPQAGSFDDASLLLRQREAAARMGSSFS